MHCLPSPRPAGALLGHPSFLQFMLAWRLPGLVGGRLALASLFLLIWPRPRPPASFPANFQFPFSSFQFLISSFPLRTSSTCHANHLQIHRTVASRPLDCSAPSSRVFASSPVTKSTVSRAPPAQPAQTLSGSPPTIPLIASLPCYIITLPFPQRTVAFPLHRTAHPLWDAPPSRTIGR